MIAGKEHKKEKFITLAAKLAANIAVPGMSSSVLGEVPQVGESTPAKPMTEPLDLENKDSVPETKTNSSASTDAFRSASSNPARGRTSPAPRPLRPQRVTHIPRPFSKIAYKRNTGVADSDGLPYTNTEDVALLAKLGYSVDKDYYLFLPRGEEKEDLYSYVEKVAGVSKDVARCIDQGTAFSSEHLKDMDYDVPKGYEIKGDLVAPIEKKAEATHELKSSNIRAVGYDKENKKLEVAFHSGGNYTYNDVPKSLFDRIKRVKSPGKFFHKHIKRDNKFEYNRLEKESANKIIPQHIRDLMIRRSQGDKSALEALQRIGKANAAKRARLKPIKDLINRTSEPVAVAPKPTVPATPIEQPVQLDPQTIKTRFDQIREAIKNAGRTV